MKKLISILLIAVLMLSGCAGRKNNEQNGLTSFTAYDLDGDTQTEKIFEGKKLTMVNIWATYCGPCIQEMPFLAEIHEEYADKGLQVVGIIGDVGSHTGDGADTARSLLEDADANYVNLLPSADMQSFLSSFAYVPTTVFLNEKGEQVGGAQIGARPKAEWEAIITELLGEVS